MKLLSVPARSSLSISDRNAYFLRRNPHSFNVIPVAPGVFTANGNGAGVIAGTFELIDGRANGILENFPVYSCGTEPLSCVEVPFTIGTVGGRASVLIFYGTGFRSASKVQAFIGGIEVPVSFAGPQQFFAGLDQINITLNGLTVTGKTTLYVVADGMTSNIATLSIR
jgi:uncharacterized protein (TIGR03437 family)